MTLTELQTEVYTLTNRPDLTAETLLAVRAATLKLHQTDYFYKDLFETGISFSSAEYEQSIEYNTLIPLWRALKYIRKTDVDGDDTLPFFTVIQPESVLDDYNLNRTDVCYVAGTNIQIKSSTEFQYAFLGCYLNPNITESGWNTWIGRDHPYAIVFDAAATIFKMIGKTSEFAAYTGLALEQRDLVVKSNIQATGY